MFQPAILNELWEALGRVLDPELDTPITELGFISELQIDERASQVRVRLRLPTFWCAANFAYLMAQDARKALLEVPGVTQVEVILEDHFAEEEISTGVNRGLSFKEIFPEEADEDLVSLRRRFTEKAYMQRHELLMRLLLRHLRPEEVVRLPLSALEEDEEGVWLNWMGERIVLSHATGLWSNYLSRRRALGLEVSPEAPLGLDPAGLLIHPEALQEYLVRCRTTRLNIGFNRALCESLLDARYELGRL